MKNLIKKVSEKSVEKAFTSLGHYQPKMPVSLIEKVQAKNKKD